MTTGQRIQAARKRAGLTQKELGKRIGVSFQGIAQWENNLRNPKYETLQRIAEALGTTADDLKGRESSMDDDVREILTRQLERLDEKADRLVTGPEQLAQITHAMCAIADRLVSPTIFGNRAERREDDKATEAVTPAAMREVYAAAVRNSVIHGDFLTGRCPFCESNRNNFSADLATGKWHCFDEGISGNYTDFLERLNASPAAPVDKRDANWAALLIPEDCHGIFVCMDGELFDERVKNGMISLHDARHDVSVPCFIAASPTLGPQYLGFGTAKEE